MATKFQRVLSLVLALLCVMGCLSVPVFASEGSSDSSTGKKSFASDAIEAAKELLGALSYEEYLKYYSDEELYPNATGEIVIKGTDFTASKTTASVKTDTLDGITGVTTGKEGIITYEFDVPSTAKYQIRIVYASLDLETGCATIQRTFRINDKVPFKQAYTLSFTKNWRVEYDEAYKIVTEDGDERLFKTDVENNEIRPDAFLDPEWTEYSITDVDGFYEDPFTFVFTEGHNSISFEAISEEMSIAEIVLYPCETVQTYEEFISKYSNAPKGTGIVKIEAEYPYRTSTNTIYPIEDRASACTSPCDTHRVLLNTIGGDKWQTAQQWVSYQFQVESDGLYQIVARFAQNLDDGMYSTRNLYLYSDETVAEGQDGYYDGIPFAEARELRFNYNETWQVTPFCFGSVTTDEKGNTVIDYTNCEFYFKAGVTYTMKLECALGTMGEIVSAVQTSLNTINDAYLNIMKLTGTSPDADRDYSFSSVMPDTIISLIKQSIVVENIGKELQALAGVKSSNVATLEKISRLLEKMGSDPEEEIAKNLSELKTYIGNLGTWLTDAKTQPLQVDYFTVQNSEEKLPEANPSFFRALAHEFSSFIQSFFRNYDHMGASAEDLAVSDAIEVWNAFGRDQNQVMRNLINNGFTPDTGISVDLKLIAGGTLLPSILAGVGPDVYIGIDAGTIINYAIRGALVNIENFDGFTDLLYYQVDEDFNTLYDENGKPIRNEKAQFNDSAMLVLGIADAEEKMHYYGLPETQGFSMMFIRTDILADLGITTLDTWDDLIEAATVLAQNSMTIGLSTDYSIYLYQMGGNLFADNGMRINLDSNLALDCMETMVQMFTMYSFPYNYSFANRFRTGEMPIGISDYCGTYNHLVVFATEIRGSWEFVPVPGYERVDEDGNTYINNDVCSGVSALVLPSGCKHEEKGWQFMNWYVSKDFQVDYSNEMIAILGDSAKHNTANINALQVMPWTNKEKTNLMTQFEKLAAIPNYPGSYIIGRYTNFTFLAAYNDGADPVTKMLSYINIINKEITRKRSEFGLETLDIGETLASKRRGMILDALEELSAEDQSKFADEIKALKDAIYRIDDDGTWKAYCDDYLINAFAAAGKALYDADNEKFATIYKYVNTVTDALKEYQASYPLREE